MAQNKESGVNIMTSENIHTLLYDIKCSRTLPLLKFHQRVIIYLANNQKLHIQHVCVGLHYEYLTLFWIGLAGVLLHSPGSLSSQSSSFTTVSSIICFIPYFHDVVALPLLLLVKNPFCQMFLLRPHHMPLI